MPVTGQGFSRACALLEAGYARRSPELRELAGQSPASFLNLSRCLLRDCRDTGGARQVLSMLAARGWLAPLIRSVAARDPGLAGGMAHLGLSVYPALERELASGETAPPVSAGGADPEFMQELLAVIETALSLLPSPSAAARSLDARSRATLARIYSQLAVARQDLDVLLADPEPRVRANAVEALWNLDTEPALDRLAAAARDPHHRVAANGLVGLSLAGDERAVEGLAAMAASDDPAARLAAIWAMGRTGDTRFAVFLKDWRQRNRHDTAALRGSLAALVRLRQAEALATARPARLAVVSCRAAAGEWIVEAAVRAPEGGPPAIRGGHLQPWLGESPVWSYRASYEPAPEPACAFCLLPPGAAREEFERAWVRARGECRAGITFDLSPGGPPVTHAVRFHGAAPESLPPELPAAVRQIAAGPWSSAAPEECLGDLAAALQGLWVIRFAAPPPGGGELTLRLRSAFWAAGPAAAPPPEPLH